MPWKTFLAAHWGAIAAADFFTVEVLTLFGLVRYHVLFFIDIATRKVLIAGISSQPNAAWVAQIARNLTDPPLAVHSAWCLVSRSTRHKALGTRHWP